MSYETLAAQLGQHVRRAREAADALEDLVAYAPDEVTEALNTPIRVSRVPVPATPRVSRASFPPVVHTLVPAPMPALNKRQRWSQKEVLLGLGIGAGAILLLWLSRRASAAPAAALPRPEELPQQDPIPPPSPPGPLIIDEVVIPGDVPKQAIASWSSDKKTLNHLTGYHRAKKKELGPEAIAMSPQLLRQGTYGEVIFFNADGGKRYAAAIEEHTNVPGTAMAGGKPHKGISMFIEDAA